MKSWSLSEHTTPVNCLMVTILKLFLEGCHVRLLLFSSVNSIVCQLYSCIIVVLARLQFELEAIECVRLLNREIIEVEDVVVFFVAH